MLPPLFLLSLSSSAEVGKTVTWRGLCPSTPETGCFVHACRPCAFTCWSTVTGGRANNWGSRIDLILAATPVSALKHKTHTKNQAAGSIRAAEQNATGASGGASDGWAAERNAAGSGGGGRRGAAGSGQAVETGVAGSTGSGSGAADMAEDAARERGAGAALGPEAGQAHCRSRGAASGLGEAQLWGNEEYLQGELDGGITGAAAQEAAHAWVVAAVSGWHKVSGLPLAAAL